MISDADLKEIKPKTPTAQASSGHIQSGIPLPKAARVRTFSPAEWEEFIEEWSTSLGGSYGKVRRFGGSGDLGVDIAGFVASTGFEGAWDNYQCKHYSHPLRPSDAWVEIGKIIYYAHLGEYSSPRAHYFVCSQGIGTSLEKLLNDPDKLKIQTRANWDKHCKTGITDTCEVKLEGDLLAFFEAFDFKIFSSKSLIELIDGHATTGYHAVRFGGGLPLRPVAGAPPSAPAPEESRYIRQLLDAYADHLGSPLATPDDLKSNAAFSKDFLRQRERFYHAESLRNFARDTVPEGTFDALQDEVYHGVVDVCEGTYANGFERMKATVAQAAQVALTANALAPATKSQDRQGICHQLANDDRLTWVPNDV
ncbi:MAG: restriction endonuclease [Rhizobiaceae bacterium]|nr:restriction endonuclease [Rhizobiaceae bacterium]